MTDTVEAMMRRRQPEGSRSEPEEPDKTLAQLAAIVESSTDAIIGKTLDGIITSWNRGAERLYGYSREEAVGRSIAMIVPPDRPNELSSILSRLKRGEQIDHFETVRVRKDGERVDVSISISPIKDNQGRIVGASTIARDISDRKRAEEERLHLLALEHEARIRAETERERASALAAERSAILSQIADGIILADSEGRITFVNEAGHRILGVAELGAPIEEHAASYHTFRIDGSPYPPAELPLSRAVLHGETVMGADVLIRRDDGREIIVQTNAAPVVSEDGVRLGAVASFRDITEQRDLERQKDDFLSTAAHDLKTPLTTIKGLAQMLSRKVSRSEASEMHTVIDGLAKIDVTATRMATLINELLDVTRLQMGRPLDLLPGPTDLVALVRETVAQYEHTSPHHRILLKTELPRLTGAWDARRLERVLTNLLSNAIKYSPEGGTVELTLRQEADEQGQWAVFSIRDEGLGIPAQDLPHIFERFHRGRNVSHLIPGTGIGLAGSCQIVEQHGGTISVESEERRGATFTVRLPMLSGAAEVPGVTVGEAGPA